MQPPRGQPYPPQKGAWKAFSRMSSLWSMRFRQTCFQGQVAAVPPSPSEEPDSKGYRNPRASATGLRRTFIAPQCLFDLRMILLPVSGKVWQRVPCYNRWRDARGTSAFVEPCSSPLVLRAVCLSTCVEYHPLLHPSLNLWFKIENHFRLRSSNFWCTFACRSPIVKKY